MISSVVLAAGFSSRFGSPKALAKIGSVTVIEFLLNRLANNADIDRIVVVLGADADQIGPYVLKHKKINVVYNKDYNLGQTSSFKTALAFILPVTEGIMLFPVDSPFVQPKTVKHLIDEFYLKKPLVLVPTFGATKGHPPIFSYSLKDEFLALDNASGINQVIHRHEVLSVPVSDEGIVSTFNTPQEFSRLPAKYPDLFKSV